MDLKKKDRHEHDIMRAKGEIPSSDVCERKLLLL